MAHASLLRTNTVPIPTADTMDRMNGMGMPGAPRASQLSGSATFPTTNSSSSVNTLSTATTIAAAPGGQVMATSNIINQRADASRSLYQICVALKQRLAKVPGFEEYMEQLEYMATDPDEGGPVESLWKLLRTGYPLLAIYNALQPEVPLQVQEVPEMSQAKRSKIAILRFVEACKSKLMLPTTEVFIITDLAGNDTTGFVKVTGAINHVLDLAEERGLLLQIQPYPEDDIMEPGSQMSYRDYVVRELVDTERKYVQDLENLHDLKKKLEQDGIITGDKIHDIFLNINAILDCQRKFLIRVETTNSMPQARQEWGSPFVAYEETFNMCYQPFIANQRRAGQLASEVFDKIQAAQHPVACDFNTLDGFLLKPMQRLVKYPLLLKDLLKKCEDEATKEDLTAGIDSAERVLQKANEAVNKDLLKEAVKELVTRVEDWKKHRVEQFGELLLHGVYTVVTGKGDQEKDYEIYLFQSILLCCKEVVPGKTKDKKDKTRSTGPKIRNRNAKLQLKGRIFMTNVTDVVALSKTGSYTVQIWWKGDPGVENFMIKFTNEDMMKKWAAGLEQQRKENAPRLEQKVDRVDEFAWMKNIGGELKNPYGEDADDSEDETVTNGSNITAFSATSSQPTLVSMPGTIQRNASSTSLRSRSLTNGSINSVAGDNRVPPPRFPMVPPATTLNISTLQAQVSPLPRPPESYFSPVAESPASSRASTTSGVFTGANGYPFPKTSTPQPWNPDDHNRYTAPAMPRAPSRDGSSPSNAFGPNGRNPRGPSMPVMPRDSTPPSQVRSRSLSTPDISGQPQRSTQQIPAVPGIPPHLHQNHPSHPTHVRHDSSISRSNSGSPANDLPLRTNNNSPGRTRVYAPTMSQFPAQPVYPRQGTPGTASNLPPPGPPPPGLAPLAPLDSGRSATPGLNTAPLSSSQGGPPVTPDISMPNQLKVKVNYDYNAGLYFTLVAQFNITYQSLVDRIDVKLARLTNSSIGRGDLKLRYRDEDGDFVSIGNDDDIQIAISEWREAQGGMPGGLGEIELFCVGEI
ncbi:pleckstrin domain-containing protein [Dichotomopilus funicola]|uniref:Pleckstrin homology domain-containing protein n=1 Tax=Dichotomopilus funicola TaxID=1934379 RepID=A0AAN6ZKK0_9PEZI|nr:Pleckstrin homology domain-containing protein [Dichotomopilus funicola]